jgi:hypothetical protein
MGFPDDQIMYSIQVTILTVLLEYAKNKNKKEIHVSLSEEKTNQKKILRTIFLKLIVLIIQEMVCFIE